MSRPAAIDKLNRALAPNGRALPQTLGGHLSVLLQWRDGTQAYWGVEGLDVGHSEQLAQDWAQYPLWERIVDDWACA